jgi:hypothetical protein
MLVGLALSAGPWRHGGVAPSLIGDSQLVVVPDSLIHLGRHPSPVRVPRPFVDADLYVVALTVIEFVLATTAHCVDIDPQTRPV